MREHNGLYYLPFSEIGRPLWRNIFSPPRRYNELACQPALLEWLEGQEIDIDFLSMNHILGKSNIDEKEIVIKIPLSRLLVDEFEKPAGEFEYLIFESMDDYLLTKLTWG